jgi:hydroxylamine dehydrogenase
LGTGIQETKLINGGIVAVEGADIRQLLDQHAPAQDPGPGNPPQEAREFPKGESMIRYAWMALLALGWVFTARTAYAVPCLDCHTETTPHQVADWFSSKHRLKNVGCADCHGDAHQNETDVAKAERPTPATCGSEGCHEKRVAQYRKGKHALAWTAMSTMPTIHWQPMATIQGQKGCGGCHKIGEKGADELQKLVEQGSVYGHAACDSCHTRHTFSVKEARAPQACQTCHMGFDHPQWEMYSASKHGVRALLRQNGTLPETAAAPTCQDCHMQDGDHEVRTPWGFLAVRLPLSEDPDWKADQVTILQALGVLDPEGKPTARLDAVKVAGLCPVVRLERDEA